MKICVGGGSARSLSNGSICAATLYALCGILPTVSKQDSKTHRRALYAVSPLRAFRKQKDGPKPVVFVGFVRYQNRARAFSVPTAIALPLVL